MIGAFETSAEPLSHPRGDRLGPPDVDNNNIDVLVATARGSRMANDNSFPQVKAKWDFITTRPDS